MPPFRLELPDKKVEKHEPKLFFTKNEYRPGVKVTDWVHRLEGLPMDTNPYCPGKVNYFLSHYNRWSTAPDEKFTTTTQLMLEQIFLKEEVNQLFQNPNKFMVNYYTYKDTLACETDLTNKKCPQVCAESYLTTMQDSYTPPYPYPMQRFFFPTFPFLQNRKFKWDNPELSEHKFYDDGCCRQIAQIQKIKGFRTKSYDPVRAMNTDGTLPPERAQKCLELDF